MRIKMRLFLAGIIVLAAISLPAQEIPSRVNDGVSTAQKKEVKRNAYSDLNLNREQTKQLQSLNKENKQKAKEITSDSTLTPQQRRKQLQELKKNQVEKRKAILTPEQYARYEQNVKELKKGGAAISEEKRVVNNIEKNKAKDANGLSRNATKKTSKSEKANPNRSNDLNLTSKQKQDLKQISDEYNSRLQLVKGDVSKNAREKQSEIQQIQREYDMQLGIILTAEQKAKWDERQRRSRLTMSPRALQNNRQGLNGSIK